MNTEPAAIISDLPGHDDDHIQTVATKAPRGYVGVVIGQSNPASISTFIWLSPNLARELAARLLRKADEAAQERRR